MMRTNHPLDKWLAVALALAGLIVLPACTVKVNKGAKGEEKKVDIETPVGGIHVDKSADPRDTGLPVYPGAKQKTEEKNGHESANVNISAGMFGVKVVAIEFLSNDPPDKVAAYYKDQLKHFGTILECHTSSPHHDAGDVDVHLGKDGEKTSNLLSCEHDSGNTLELKVGTKQNQHIVSISSQEGGKGTDFALVFVQTRGGDRDTI